MKTTLNNFLITTTLILYGVHSQCLLPRVPIPFTNICHCPNVWTICKSPQTKDNFCQCSCSPDLTCTFPKAQDQNDCDCKCKPDFSCKPPHYQDIDTCDCLCPKKNCKLPKVLNQSSCNCECPNKDQQCPLLKKFDDASCSCVCRLPAICLNPDKAWDSYECKCLPLVPAVPVNPVLPINPNIPILPIFQTDQNSNDQTDSNVTSGTTEEDVLEEPEGLEADDEVNEDNSDISDGLKEAASQAEEKAKAVAEEELAKNGQN